MDFQSLAIGFLTGAFTGAAGNYLADKYTDTRRRKEEERETKRFWRDVESRFPKIIQLNTLVQQVERAPSLRVILYSGVTPVR